MRSATLALLAAIVALSVAARADELSGDDKLRMLYSRRFAFTPEGPPLLTVELMGGQRRVRLGAPEGVSVLPDGAGGPVVAGGRDWEVTAAGARPARVRFWTVVSRAATDAEVALWRSRGFEARTFETGALFGVEGDVIDSRETYLGVAPEATEEAAAKAGAALAARFKVEGTFVYPELVDRPRGQLVAREARTGIEVRNEGVLWFAPAVAGGALTVQDVVHGGGGSQVGAEKRETRRYSGRLYVTLGRDGLLSVVNAVPEDRMLAGLVPSEIFAESPPEALKAQAVAARGELLARIGTRHFADPFLLCATQHCQVYGGIGPEDARTTRAVQATRGEVLLRDGGGGLVPGYYSSSCGGHSEHNEHIWGTPPDPSLRGHLDALGADVKELRAFASGVTDENVRAFLDAPPASTFCGRTRYAKGRHRWRVTLEAAELDRLVAAAHPEIGAVRELVPLERGVSGRVRALRVVGARGEVVLRGDLRIRRLFGGLRSTLFVVSAAPARGRIASWTFAGAGFGHGVGMCQTGAIGMAESGLDYKRILRHYYPGSHVRRLY